MKTRHFAVCGLLVLAAFGLGWTGGKSATIKTFYATEARFYGGKVQEWDNRGGDLTKGVGAFLSARYVYCANRGHGDENFERFLPESVSEFQNDFGKDPCLYTEELRNLREK